MSKKREVAEAVPVLDEPEEKAPWVLGLSVVYALSGFCALIYQTVWIHGFSIAFGSTIFSTSVVISVFFGGMALGNLIFGKLSLRSTNPVRLFALLQVGIGLYAVFFPFLFVVLERLYAVAYPFASTGLMQATLVRMGLAILILIVPTTLMGGTFPLLARHLVRRLHEVGARTGMLYGVNALGGAAGAVLSAFIFLRYFGESNTNMLAGALSVAAGIAAFAFSKRTLLESPSAVKEEPETTVDRPAGSKRLVTLTMSCFALTGLVSMAYEIYWLRYLALMIGDTIHLYTGIIAVFVFGIGLGSVLMGPLASRTRWPLALFGLIELGTGAFTVAAVYIAALRFESITSGVQGHGLLLQLLLFGLLIIPALLMGAKFPVVARIVAPSVQGVGNQTGKAYALNTMGALLGLLLCGFCFFPLFGLQGTLFVLFAGSMVSATLLISADPHFHRPLLNVLPLVLAIIVPLTSSAILGGRLPDVLLQKMTSSGQDKLLVVREGLVGTTSVTYSPEHGYALYDNGVVIGGEQRGNFKTGGYIPVLIQRDPPKRVLSLAFGAGVSSQACRSLPSLEEITCVDISRENIDAALEYFPENAGLKRDQRAEFVIADAYNFVKYSEDSYDLIMMEPTPPMLSFRCASLYTKEYYEHAAKRLNPNGLFTQVLPLRNLSSDEGRGVMKTFAAAFPECILWYNSWDCVMIGSKQTIEIDAQEVVRRLQVPSIQEALSRNSPQKYHLPANFLSGLLLASEEFRRVAADGVIYTDDRSDLRYSTGRDASAALIEEVHANLSSWEKLQKEVFVFQQFGGEIPKLVGLRELLMLGIYEGDSRCGKLRSYIEEFSFQKAVDYQALVAELKAKKQLSSVEKDALDHAQSRLIQLESTPRPAVR